MTDYETYDLGDFKLQGGGVLPGAWIAYKTFGDSKNPAILYPSWYSGTIADNEWLIGQSMPGGQAKSTKRLTQY